ncbi:MAG: tRNA (N(6)-L-threonylcarbamoyladenosine(37)-C(2))-methylthiotransferase MtaB [Pirellulales bacterium]|nr:tRNA (N(6)-L-threonylcarbamoyladenosine(37)-C(2))-methylthiotransferase MtaB [Pirellulales bacterium]
MSMSRPGIRTVTLGCKVNQYETEYVREGLLSAGYVDAAKGQPADLCIVNTCTVTQSGDAKSRQTIRQLARRNPDARIIVMGCYATRAPDEVSQLPGVVEVVTDKRELPDLLGRHGVVDIPTGVSGLADRHRAYLKVQDGCLLRCSFCIIPKVRPQMYSRPMEEIIDEANRLIARGFRELVLTGIHLGHYGVDFNRGKPKRDWIRLSHLVRSIAQLPGDFRIRISSIEATEVTHELIDVLSECSDKVCPHLHISMQSGSDAVLRRMRRRWGSERFIDRCRLLKQTLDIPAITTDIIVGFPGETENEFMETCLVVREVGFSKIHIFPFSARRGTAAAKMEGQISPQEKQARGRRLVEVEQEMLLEYLDKLKGKKLQVLFESLSKDESRLVGTSCRYATVEVPTNEFPGAIDDVLGSLCTVRAGEVVDDRIRATHMPAANL